MPSPGMFAAGFPLDARLSSASYDTSGFIDEIMTTKERSQGLTVCTVLKCVWDYHR